MKIVKKRKEWLGGRIAAKMSLSYHYRKLLNHFEILIGDNREPYCEIDGVVIDVSITHSNGIALAIIGNQAIDIETVDNRSSAFIREVFAVEEIERFGLLSSEPVFITMLWTIKESHLKRMRIGLRTDLQKVIISKIDGSNALVNSPQGESRCIIEVGKNWVVTIALPNK